MGEQKFVLKLQNVHRQLGKFKIHDISFALEPGYIMGLVGRNGAGKSTLIKLILGVYSMDGGEIEINGISMVKEEKSVKEQMGYVLEEKLFSDGMSLIENARQYGRYYPNFKEDNFRK